MGRGGASRSLALPSSRPASSMKHSRNPASTAAPPASSGISKPERRPRVAYSRPAPSIARHLAPAWLAIHPPPSPPSSPPLLPPPPLLRHRSPPRSARPAAKNPRPPCLRDRACCAVCGGAAVLLGHDCVCVPWSSATQSLGVASVTCRVGPVGNRPELDALLRVRLARRLARLACVTKRSLQAARAVLSLLEQLERRRARYDAETVRKSPFKDGAVAAPSCMLSMRKCKLRTGGGGDGGGGGGGAGLIGVQGTVKKTIVDPGGRRGAVQTTLTRTRDGSWKGVEAGLVVRMVPSKRRVPRSSWPVEDEFLGVSHAVAEGTRQVQKCTGEIRLARKDAATRTAPADQASVASVRIEKKAARMRARNGKREKTLKALKTSTVNGVAEPRTEQDSSLEPAIPRKRPSSMAADHGALPTEPRIPRKRLAVNSAPEWKTTSRMVTPMRGRGSQKGKELGVQPSQGQIHRALWRQAGPASSRLGKTSRLRIPLDR